MRPQRPESALLQSTRESEGGYPGTGGRGGRDWAETAGQGQGVLREDSSPASVVDDSCVDLLGRGETDRSIGLISPFPRSVWDPEALHEVRSSL